MEKRDLVFPGRHIPEKFVIRFAGVWDRFVLDGKDEYFVSSKTINVNNYMNDTNIGNIENRLFLVRKGSPDQRLTTGFEPREIAQPFLGIHDTIDLTANIRKVITNKTYTLNNNLYTCSMSFRDVTQEPATPSEHKKNDSNATCDISTIDPITQPTAWPNLTRAEAFKFCRRGETFNNRLIKAKTYSINKFDWRVELRLQVGDADIIELSPSYTEYPTPYMRNGDFAYYESTMYKFKKRRFILDPSTGLYSMEVTIEQA